MIEKDFSSGLKSTANFLEPGGNGCVLRVASCEVKWSLGELERTVIGH